MGTKISKSQLVLLNVRYGKTTKTITTLSVSKTTRKGGRTIRFLCDLVSFLRYSIMLLRIEYKNRIVYNFQATGSWDFTVRLWTLSRQGGNDKVTVLKGHSGNVHAVAFSKDGMLVSSIAYNCGGLL